MTLRTLTLSNPTYNQYGFFYVRLKKTFKKLEESEINPEVQEKVESLPENASEQGIKNLNIQEDELTSKDDSVFKRVLENGFDGITTNPNYKLLALLIILLINLSLFFLVGNLGKTFLKNSGILG